MVILIVDSSVRVAESLTALVAETRLPATTYHAASYAEALELFIKKKPGIVLLDMNLPANRSVELLRKIKAGIEKTVVIALLNNDNHHFRNQCRVIGTDIFLDKYHDHEQLPAVISAIAWKRTVENKEKPVE